MCEMKELVKVVKDDELATPWVAAVAESGRRVVFVREADEGLIGHYCGLGPGTCPIWLALVQAAP